MPLIARIIRAHLRSGLRGQTRVTNLLAHRVPSLRSVPISFKDRPPVYMDLRTGAGQWWLEGDPWETSPQEPGEQAVMRRFIKEGDAVFDIGANIGLHTVLISRLVGPGGRVFAFEPNPELVPNLSRTVAGLGNVTLFACALSDEERDSTLFVPTEHDSKASLQNWTGEGDIHALPCLERPLDDFVAAGEVVRPEFIKCDVEGAELKVFRGGRGLLDSPAAPFILFEINEASARSFGQTTFAARDFLAALPQPRYQFFDVQEDGGLAAARFKDDREYWNILAVPLSRIPDHHELSGLETN